MEPPDATAEWRLSTSPVVTSTAKLESTARASAEKYPGSSEKVDGLQRSLMVAASMRQMQEPQVGGVPRSVLQRLLGKIPSETGPSTPIHSPRRRCSAASAAMASMVHSPREFANGERSPLGKRDPTSQTAPYQFGSPMVPTPEFGSYESTTCSSPIPITSCFDQPIPSDDEEDESADEVVRLRQQVALLVKSLEDEKKRRASEQQLMQTKIIELQGLIRGNEHDDHDEMESGTLRNTSSSAARENERLENNQVRRWSAPVDEEEEEAGESASCDCSGKQKRMNGETTGKIQLTRLRARMHAIVIDTQRETQTLRSQLEGAKRNHSKREKQLTLETTIKVAALEQKHAVATTRLAQQAAKSAAQVEKLQAEKQELLATMQAQQERLKQLELALSGKKIVDASR